MDKNKILREINSQKIFLLLFLQIKSNICAVDNNSIENDSINSLDSYFRFNDVKKIEKQNNECFTEIINGKKENVDNNNLCCGLIYSSTFGYEENQNEDIDLYKKKDTLIFDEQENSDNKVLLEKKKKFKPNLLKKGKRYKFKNPILNKRRRRTIEEIKNPNPNTNIDNVGMGRKKKGRYKNEENCCLNDNIITNGLKKHTKYEKGNIIVKIRSLIFKELVSFINKKIGKIYNDLSNDEKDEIREIIKEASGLSFEEEIDNICHKKNFLVKLNRNFITDPNIGRNRNALKQPIRNILSEEISNKYKKLPSDYNKKMIESLQGINELGNIFNLTLLDCINHFCDKKTRTVLEGFTVWKEYCQHLEKEEEGYINCFYEVMYNLEEICAEENNFTREDKKKG